MSHLPECIYMPEQFDPEQNIIWGGMPCICDPLRACEQRVTERWESLRGWGETYAYKTGSDNGYDVGYYAGLDAAREAILHDESCLSNLDDADERDCDCTRPYAVAAIDALREKP